MLTRLEVDGFKNLLNFRVDFGPFTCIAGANGVGKSNIFDAIRFLSLLADNTIMEAALRVRGGDPDSIDIRDIFWRNEGGHRNHFRIAAEMIVNPHVRDDFGRLAEANSTYLRYEIEIGYEASDNRGNFGRLVLLSESLDYITEGDSSKKIKFPNKFRSFKPKLVENKRKAAGYISSQQAKDGQTEIVIHQDGGSRGPGQTAPARSAPRTIVGTSNTSTTPTILAARREMQRWKFLALEPSSMRLPDRFQTENPFIGDNGAHIPAALYRLATDAKRSNGDPADVYQDIANRLSELVSVAGVTIDIDEVRQRLTLRVQERSGVTLPAASLSEGTLRFLALSVLAADDQADSLTAIEEPENGIHPAKMPEMVTLLHELAVDPLVPVEQGNPFRQVIVATHSPAFVQLQRRDDLLSAQETLIRTNDGGVARTVRCFPVPGSWRDRAGEKPVDVASLLVYLTAAPGVQLELLMDLALNSTNGLRH